MTAAVEEELLLLGGEEVEGAEEGDFLPLVIDNTLSVVDVPDDN